MLWTAEEQFGPGNPFAQIQTSGTHDFSNWTHVLVQRIGNNASNWKIYINGVSVAFQIDANQLSSGDIGGLSSSTAKLGLGGYIYDGNVYDQFRGDLKQVRLYKRALSATEISANFANTCSYDPVNQTSLVFWAPLRETTTSVSVADISSTASTGTHSGSGNSMSRTGLTSSTCGATPAEVCVERENGYVYSFNGKMDDREVEGQQDYGMRIYDKRLARFKSVDPITEEYPELTPYQFAGNTPIQAIDLDGLEPWFTPFIFASRPTPLIRPVTETMVKLSRGSYKWDPAFSVAKNMASMFRQGRALHLERQIEWLKEGFTAERWLGKVNGKGNRVDGFKIEKGQDGIIRGFIRELKPNNSLGRAKGIEQLRRYVDAATKKFPDVQEWHPQLELYGLYYTIGNGDNLAAIAKKFGTSVEQLLKYNNIKETTELKAGEVILINIGFKKQESSSDGFEKSSQDNTQVVPVIIGPFEQQQETPSCNCLPDS